MLAQIAFLTQLTPRIHRISHLDSVYARVSGASGNSLVTSGIKFVKQTCIK
ncbi:hypothetical protein [uncultured Helicobacter sp.]|uniref:hypothetical protein n=1 Tax=uncultured Helicobacter sp. TaxID=175537 RepID=UPI003753DE0C